MSRNLALEQAIAELAKYYGVKSKNEFYLRAITGEITPTPTSGIDPQASQHISERVAELISNLCDGGVFVGDILGWDIFNDLPAADVTKLAESFMIVTDAKWPNPTSPGAVALLPKLKLKGQATPIGINEILGAKVLGKDNVINTGQQPSKDAPALSTISIFRSLLNFGSRDSGALQIFMGGIPTQEWSRCTPYVNLQVIPATPFDKDSISSFGMMNFLVGDSPEPDQITSPMNQASTVPGIIQNSGGPIEGAYHAAGMEIFTSPQTMLPTGPAGIGIEKYNNYDSVGPAGYLQDAAILGNNPHFGGAGSSTESYPGGNQSRRSAPVIDAMRPFLTVKSIDISVKPTRGMMSTKQATIALTLHDRSRLAEISDLIRPENFGRTEVLLEYGWSHPDGDLIIPAQKDGKTVAGAGSRNSFGKFLNALRVREKFGVYNSTTSFTPDGQAEINLTLVTKGATQFNMVDIGTGGGLKAKWKALEEIVETAATARAIIMKSAASKKLLVDTVGKLTIPNLNPSNPGDVVSAKNLKAITKFRSELAKKIGNGGEAPDVKKFVDELQVVIDRVDEVQGSITKVIADKIKALQKTGTDPWLLDNVAGKKKVVWENCMKRDDAKWASFAKIMTLFVGQPLVSSGEFSEVQLLFYPLNGKSSYGNNKNIGSFPIQLTGAGRAKGPSKGFTDLLNAEIKKYVQVSMQQFLNLVNLHFIGNEAAVPYGFSSIYSQNAKGKVSIRSNFRNKPASLQSAKDKVLADAYGDDTDLVFVQPRIRMFLETVPHRPGQPGKNDSPRNHGSKGTIARVHFFDESATKYSSLHDILTSARNDEVSQLRTKMVVAKKGSDQSKNSEAWNKVMEMLGKASWVSVKGDYLSINGGAPALKWFIKSNMPSVVFGHGNSSVISANAATQNDAKTLTLHMLRADKESGNSAMEGERQRGLPTRMMPLQVSMEMFGCPLLSHGSQFFVDFGTGTTMDNIYVVNGLQHKIEPGSFKTTCNMLPLDAYGQYRSMDSLMRMTVAQFKEEEESNKKKAQAKARKNKNKNKKKK